MLANAVKSGCDTFVTADVKYNVFLDAKAMGINLMDAGHYATENVVVPAMAEFLTRTLPELKIQISCVHPEVYQQA